MSEDRRHESARLGDYEVLDGSDTLNGAPGDDPLDRGLVPPDRWSAGMRYGSTAAEQEAGKSLDQLLAGEEPDADPDLDDQRPEEDDWDENATDEDVARMALDDGPDSRAGRLVADDATQGVRTADLIAHDSGIDGGGASAEEAAVHVVTNSDAEL
jgi:Family of unknown function (DUF5709)